VKDDNVASRWRHARQYYLHEGCHAIAMRFDRVNPNSGIMIDFYDLERDFREKRCPLFASPLHIGNEREVFV
jgi:hypothetical protein